MQVFGLPRHVTRSAGAASRLLGAKTPNIEAQRRRDAVARWRRAMAQGLTSEQAAKAVGASRAALYRWEKESEHKSRRPHTTRKATWTPELAEAVEALRLDNPMWGKRKIAALLRLEGIVVSASMVGRILRKPMDRGVVVQVPTLRRNPGARRVRPTAVERYARRLPKGLKPTTPGEIVQIDTLFVNVRPDKAIKHFTAYDPVAKWTTGHVATRATATAAARLLDKLIADAPFEIKGIQVDGGSEFKAAFEQACKDKGLVLTSCPPRARSSTAPSSATRAPGATSSTPRSTCRTASKSCSRSSTPSLTASTTTGRIKPLAISPQQPISNPSAAETPRLICPELGQLSGSF